jgi:hypothetical protein
MSKEQKKVFNEQAIQDKARYDHEISKQSSSKKQKTCKRIYRKFSSRTPLLSLDSFVNE